MIATVRAVDEERIIRAARSDFTVFCRLLWPVLDPGVKIIWSWHLDAIAEHLGAVADGEIRRLNINLPPGMGKTRVISQLWPVYLWLHRPEWRFICASYDYKLANRINVERRKLIRSRRYQALRPGYDLEYAQREKSYFVNDVNGWMRTAAPNGEVTGDHGDGALLDDLMAPPKRKGSSIEDTVEFLQVKLPSRFRVMDEARLVNVHQRLHSRDPTGFFHSKDSPYGEFVDLVLPNEFDPSRSTVTVIGWQDPRAEPGELLAPHRISAEKTATLKQQPSVYATQYQQQVGAAAGNKFARKWWRWWTVLPAVDEWIGVVDANFGDEDTKDPDFVCMQVWARCGGNAHLVDQRRGKWDFAQTLREFDRFAKAWPCVYRWRVERKANGAAIISMLKRKHRGLEGVEPGQASKESRAESVMPFIVDGFVYLPGEKRQQIGEPDEILPGLNCEKPDQCRGTWRPDLWVGGFVAEAEAFPDGDNDDQVDGATMALLQMSDKLAVTGPPVGTAATRPAADRAKRPARRSRM